MIWGYPYFWKHPYLQQLYNAFQVIQARDLKWSPHVGGHFHDRKALKKQGSTLTTNFINMEFPGSLKTGGLGSISITQLAVYTL